MQPQEFLLHLLLKCSLLYLRHKESQVASRRWSLLHFGSDFCYMFWDVFLERFWMHLCSLNCICSLVVLLLGLVFRYKFERFLKDLLDTCLKFLLHSVPDPPRQRKASVTHDRTLLDREKHPQHMTLKGSCVTISSWEPVFNHWWRSYGEASLWTHWKMHGKDSTRSYP